MKYFLFAISFGIVISFFNSCKKGNREIVPAFYEQASGIWVPYEIIEFGAIHNVSGTTTSVFGSYAAGVQLNKDRTFIPIVWYDKDHFTFQTPETGNFEYLSNNKLRFTGGLSNFECDIIKFEGDDLWLKMFDVLWKFKRQP